MSSVAVLPMVTSATTAPANVPHDRLLALSQAFEQAWQNENAAYRELDLVADAPEFERLRATFRYQGHASVDKRLMNYLGWGVDQLDGLDSFSPADIEKLRGALGAMGRKADARIRQLVAAAQAMTAREQEVGLLAAEEKAADAQAKTSAIVGEIEDIPARSLAEVFVKVRAVRWCRTNDIEDDVSGEATDMRLLQRILEDLDRMAQS